MRFLFIFWDSDKSNYLEALYFPVFNELKKRLSCQIHVIQFSWADSFEVKRIERISNDFDLTYNHVRIFKGSLPILGVLSALIRGVVFISSYIKKNNIKVLIPRSTMPALIMNKIIFWIKLKNIKLIFDADGFPLDERLDHKIYQANSFLYKYLKNEERKMLKNADKILVRSEKSILFHQIKNFEILSDKFFKVPNGRNETFFKFNLSKRIQLRAHLGIKDSEILFVYSGSLGPQYAWDEMLNIFSFYHFYKKCKFLILSRFEKPNIPIHLKDEVILVNPAFNEIPNYLSASDIAFNLRKGNQSLKGIHPLKLGEYLLCGLPVISSIGIGDLDEILLNKSFCFLKEKNTHLKDLVFWIDSISKFPKDDIRSFGVEYFGFENSVAAYLKALV